MYDYGATTPSDAEAVIVQPQPKKRLPRDSKSEPSSPSKPEVENSKPARSLSADLLTQQPAIPTDNFLNSDLLRIVGDTKQLLFTRRVAAAQYLQRNDVLNRLTKRQIQELQEQIKLASSFEFELRENRIIAQPLLILYVTADGEHSPDSATASSVLKFLDVRLQQIEEAEAEAKAREKKGNDARAAYAAAVSKRKALYERDDKLAELAKQINSLIKNIPAAGQGAGLIELSENQEIRREPFANMRGKGTKDIKAETADLDFQSELDQSRIQRKSEGVKSILNTLKIIVGRGIEDNKTELAKVQEYDQKGLALNKKQNEYQQAAKDYAAILRGTLSLSFQNPSTLKFNFFGEQGLRRLAEKFANGRNVNEVVSQFEQAFRGDDQAIETAAQLLRPKRWWDFGRDKDIANIKNWFKTGEGNVVAMADTIHPQSGWDWFWGLWSKQQRRVELQAIQDSFILERNTQRLIRAAEQEVTEQGIEGFNKRVTGVLKDVQYQNLAIAKAHCDEGEKTMRFLGTEYLELKAQHSSMVVPTRTITEIGAEGEKLSSLQTSVDALAKQLKEGTTPTVFVKSSSSISASFSAGLSAPALKKTSSPPPQEEPKVAQIIIEGESYKIKLDEVLDERKYSEERSILVDRWNAFVMGDSADQAEINVGMKEKIQGAFAQIKKQWQHLSEAVSKQSLMISAFDRVFSGLPRVNNAPTCKK